MAQRLVDDLDNSQFAARTVSFCLDSVVYDIDLSADNEARLKAALEPFMQAGRARGGTQRPNRPSSGRLNVSRSHKTTPGRAEQLAAIRTWARQQGFEVSERGRIPEVVQEAFESAHQVAPAARKEQSPQFSSPV